MDLDTILFGTTAVALTVGALSVAQELISDKYVKHIRRLKKEGRLRNLPLYAQELYDSSVRSLALAGENPPSFNSHFKDRLKASLHYQFTEFPTFKALYKFFTLDNPEWRPLF